MSLLQMEQVSHRYGSQRFLSRQTERTVLQDVTLTLEAGTCLGLLGQSGAGKSTLGRILLGLERPTAGRVLFEGQDIYRTAASDYRQDIQVVFQDSFAAVNPKMTAGQIIAEPLTNFTRLAPDALQHRLVTLIEQVGLTRADLAKYPNQFSGGQLQRICIARAIATNPKLIILDEAVSSLDMVNKALILALLGELKDKYDLSYLFITHDLQAAQALSDRFVILDQGHIVGEYPTRKAFADATDPHVLAIKNAMLAIHPRYRTIRK
ncbi:ATP-binding cassette domain-containing protein [Exiguobacterium sp. RIT452]|uniref:ATP-binding cassette domain-containing protein n=1 Tax=Exiguobacterium sp. RIT452 TaxID=2315552 RepID=UPI000E74E025|nr:ATP-binding cassette domain-containing protein [Exiguobacterium sp. RIT452]RJP02428.1 ATP-binding cassette domain-containing protein [Exiguobacterium sp. RIT452]